MPLDSPHKKNLLAASVGRIRFAMSFCIAFARIAHNYSCIGFGFGGLIWFAFVLHHRIALHSVVLRFAPCLDRSLGRQLQS